MSTRPSFVQYCASLLRLDYEDNFVQFQNAVWFVFINNHVDHAIIHSGVVDENVFHGAQR